MKHNLFMLMVAQLVLAAPQPALAQTGPATSLVSYPVTLGISRQDASTVAFSSSATSFECSLDDATFAACTSPANRRTYTQLHCGRSSPHLHNVRRYQDTPLKLAPFVCLVH
ncbi:MAG: hypothetical protein MUP90_04700, partial [Gammaproteobacteria bacterium]|nr:hypothetical protein [Gammaproteobacteria bacterium]